MSLPLCDQMVTLYRMENGTVSRRVVTGCCYRWKTECCEDTAGVREKRTFLLILPPGEQILPGDRVYDGLGPEYVDWQQFLPALVCGLGQVTWVCPYYLGSTHHHTEAGNG